ncbi:MAG: hypothetical protein Q4B26_16940 [Eubacteriales bacterium]|nr:hypothetical protein [Eubacteriales bacterium]
MLNVKFPLYDGLCLYASVEEGDGKLHLLYDEHIVVSGTKEEILAAVALWIRVTEIDF